MNIYVYNSSTINEYSQDDSGFLTDSSWEVIDCGNLIETIESNDDFYDITCNETFNSFWWR